MSLPEPDAPIPRGSDNPAEWTPDARGPGYLLIVDGSEEADRALRYAARRAKAIGGQITLLYVMAQAEFVQWGGVQDMIRAEKQDAAEAALARAADQVVKLSGIMPSLIVREGKLTEEISAVIAEDDHLSAIVLGAASKGAPGPLVSHFTGERAGGLPLVVIIVPGALADNAIDRLTGGEEPDTEPDAGPDSV
ncbi:universal stress protein [Pacificimonas flava]|uniref:Universal stress protein UspA n=1 Tax=Pacificimonas flava TaxID=1234595 RepID=M2U448_9SPHN|nr:universal stress protein [Pacificimonas flava]EMD82802.1 universal stress protein UspA [Pacificimonas flava]MBB5279418.1 nucleotide-binding universal stress UspA family protein [Pacificimonas flava]